MHRRRNILFRRQREDFLRSTPRAHTARILLGFNEKPVEAASIRLLCQ